MNDSDEQGFLKIFLGMQIECFPRRTVIFKENDVSNNLMYVVLDGSISVFKQKSKNNVFEDDYEKFKKKNINNFKRMTTFAGPAKGFDVNETRQSKIANFRKSPTRKSCQNHLSRMTTKTKSGNFTGLTMSAIKEQNEDDKFPDY